MNAVLTFVASYAIIFFIGLILVAVTFGSLVAIVDLAQRGRRLLGSHDGEAGEPAAPGDSAPTINPRTGNVAPRP